MRPLAASLAHAFKRHEYLIKKHARHRRYGGSQNAAWREKRAKIRASMAYWDRRIASLTTQIFDQFEISRQRSSFPTPEEFQDASG